LIGSKSIFVGPFCRCRGFRARDPELYHVMPEIIFAQKSKDDLKLSFSSK
jgi:hypothetical protein